MIRNLNFRRLIISFGLLIALLTQFQVVFACEFNDDEPQLVCCCDATDGASLDCDMGTGGGCNTLLDGMASGDANCCDSSYQHAPGATAVAPDANAQHVLLLHSSQPPPLAMAFVISDFYQSIHILRRTSALPPRLTANQTYRLTNRFRI